ncbi:MAG: NUDIX hydrolase [Brevundimonas sp.]|uniref:NUDIX domain-containing protein n=1 Tax=Brevundimonas sp. TaxID=1871086 RepID=UPI0027374020|nr:NUDIX hydrolase [Brevundimonas sp.]MDP3404413.1 NUDIX hydrolase [Brevundimonas sp.]
MNDDDPFDRGRPVPGWAKGQPLTRPWTDGGATTVFENPWMRLTAHAAVAPTGLEATYVVMRPRNLACGVLPIHTDGTVTLVGQARFALANYSWEMPEGGAPFDEDPLDGAKRELAEEAGLAAATWCEVLRMEMSNSLTDERAIAWLAWDLSEVPTDPDPTEVIAVARVPFMTLLYEIDRGGVRDAFTVATALRAYHMAREGLLPGWLAHAMLTRV